MIVYCAGPECLVRYQFGGETLHLNSRNVNGSRQMQLAKLFFRKSIDEDDFLGMIELLLELVALNVGDHGCLLGSGA